MNIVFGSVYTIDESDEFIFFFIFDFVRCLFVLKPPIFFFREFINFSGSFSMVLGILFCSMFIVFQRSILLINEALSDIFAVFFLFSLFKLKIY